MAVVSDSDRLFGTEADAKSASADDPVKWYFEEAARANGVQPPKSIRMRMVQKIRDAVKDRQPVAVVKATVTRMVEEAISPASFDEVMWKVQSELATGRTRGDKDLLSRFLEANGGRWPTGTRLKRGTHSIDFVRDVLGYDRPSYAVPWGPPKRDAVIAALKALDASGVDVSVPGVREPREGGQARPGGV